MVNRKTLALVGTTLVLVGLWFLQAPTTLAEEQPKQEWGQNWGGMMSMMNGNVADHMANAAQACGSEEMANIMNSPAMQEHMNSVDMGQMMQLSPDEMVKACDQVLEDAQVQNQ